MAVSVRQEIVQVDLLGEAGDGAGAGVVGIDPLGAARRLRRHLAHRGQDAAARLQKRRAEVAVVEQLHLGRLGGAVLDHVVDHDAVGAGRGGASRRQPQMRTKQRPFLHLAADA